MRIVVNGRFVTQNVTGVQRYAGEVVAALAEHLEVELIVPGGAEPVLPLPSGIARVRSVGKGSGHYWEQTELRAYIRSMGYPLLLNPGNTAPMRLRNQIVTHHDISYARHPESYSWQFRKIYIALAKNTLPFALKVITSSQFSKDEISRYYKIPEYQIHVIPGAPSTFEKASSITDSERPYFFAVGSLLPHKNYATLLAAFELFKQRTHSQSELLIAGGPATAGPNPLAPDIATPGIRFLGRVADNELGMLYEHAKAFVYPSKYEGFGLPPLEAQLAGCPVVVADTPAARETLRESAVYFEPTSIDALAETLEKVDQDTELRHKVRIAGFRNAGRYSWQRSGDLLAEVLHSI